MSFMTKIFGSNDTAQMEVDPTFMAARVAMRPLEYKASGRILGHYALQHRSGALNGADSLAALAHVASLRWTDSTAYCVITRIKGGWSQVTASATAVEMTMRAVLARGFSVDFTTNSTLSTMAIPPKVGAMRSSMNTSLMGVNGPRISDGVGAMSGQTLTANTLGFAVAVWPGVLATNVTGAAVSQRLGMGAVSTLYECTSPYQHPLVLSQNEGVLIQPKLAGPVVDGSYAFYAGWEWAEVEVF